MATIGGGSKDEGEDITANGYSAAIGGRKETMSNGNI
jgi:hypothetical protein